MNKNVAKELKIFTEIVCKRYSNKTRANNFNNETFMVQEIIPTSDHTATVIFEKSSVFFLLLSNIKKMELFCAN